MEVGLSFLKEIIVGVLFLVVLLCVSVPLAFAHKAQRSGVDLFHSSQYSKIVSILNCFAAGIFLGTCLLHLFPDVRDNVSAAVAAIDPNQKFPFAEFTVAMGFFLLLTIEQIMSDVRERRLIKVIEVNRENSRPPPITVTVHSNTGSRGLVSPERILPIIDETDEDNAALVESDASMSESIHQYDQDGKIEDHSSFRVAAMIVALSIHSTFEGIAIGVQTTEANVLQITSALVIHKVVIAFSLGLALVQSPLGTIKSAIFGLIFSLTTPVGILIGLGVYIYEKDLDNSIVVGTLQGIACGTFLYVTFLDVLPHEFKSHHSQNYVQFHLPKLLSFIIGFSVICLSLFLFPDS